MLRSLDRLQVGRYESDHRRSVQGGIDCTHRRPDYYHRRHLEIGIHLVEISAHNTITASSGLTVV